LINVSDDEDLSMAYMVAEREMGGNIKFMLEFKQDKTVDDEKKKSKKIKDKKDEKKKAAKKEKKKEKKKKNLEERKEECSLGN
jgi:hypothetical protein